MRAPVEHVRLSQEAREKLIRVKRTTGIENWNVLCRWAFCISLAEPTLPALVRLSGDSSVDMTWKVFGGNHAEIYAALLAVRCHRDGLEVSEDVLATQFRLHLHRGIAFLAADRGLRQLGDLFRRVYPEPGEAADDSPSSDSH